MENKYSLSQFVAEGEETFQRIKSSIKEHHIKMIQALFDSNNVVEDTYDLLFWMSIAYEAYLEKRPGVNFILKRWSDVIFAYIDRDYKKAKEDAKLTLSIIKGLRINRRFSIAAAFPRFIIYALDPSFFLHEVHFNINGKKDSTQIQKLYRYLFSIYYYQSSPFHPTSKILFYFNLICISFR